MALASALAITSPVAAGTDLSLLAWNIESDGSDAATIAEQLAEIGDHDIVALSEVIHGDLTTLKAGLRSHGNRQFESVHSLTGGHDRLAYLYDRQRLDLIDYWEYTSFNGKILNDGRHRSPLMAHFRDRTTGQEFLITLNHLARGNAQLRTEQARSLREWAKRQSLPTVAIGDFNFDFEFKTERGNRGFEEFLREGVFSWPRPEPLVDTNWYDGDDDGNDDYPGSCLDFAFVAGDAKHWSPSTSVIVRADDFPDNEQTSDHRPIVLSLTLPHTAQANARQRRSPGAEVARTQAQVATSDYLQWSQLSYPPFPAPRSCGAWKAARHRPLTRRPSVVNEWFRLMESQP